MFRRLSLQVKIMVIFAVTVTVVLAVSTLIATYLTRDPVEGELYRKALAQARLTAHLVAAPDTLARRDVLLPALAQLQRDLPGIMQADVYVHKPAHLLVATTNPRGQHLELDNLSGIEDYNEYFRPNDDQQSIETEEGRSWIISTNIVAPEGPIGCLILTVSRSSLNEITWSLVARNLLLMLASLAVVVLVLHFFFMRAVRRPVKDMIRVMESAEGGQLDARARLRSWDEIGLLAAHLNRMLRRIENFSRELGRKVEEATAQLERRNEELRRINEELFETQKTLARSERLAVAGQLAASLAHEIGTPLNSISGHVQLLARRKTNDEATARRLVVIEKQVENIVRTVRQLLSWTRKYELRMEEVDLGRVLEDAVLLASPLLEHRRIRVEMELAKDCPKIAGDSGYLHQVFLNLINNSADAMPQGGWLRVVLQRAATPGFGGEPNAPENDRIYPGGETAALVGAPAGPSADGLPAGKMTPCGQSLPPSREHGSEDAGAPAGAGAAGLEAEVVIADTGAGMPRETLAHIFDPMFTTKRIGAGAGLGLAICDQIVHQHGGSIEVESEPGKGTAFTLRFPAYAPAEPSLAEPAAPAAAKV